VFPIGSAEPIYGLAIGQASKAKPAGSGMFLLVQWNPE
jgi:hypothetical protein